MANEDSSGTLTAAWDGVTPAAAPAGSTVLMTTNLSRVVGVEITGTFTATVLLEGTFNGVTWFAANCTDLASAGATASLSAAGRRLITTSGYLAVRARCSAFTSGTASVTFAGSP